VPINDGSGLQLGWYCSSTCEERNCLYFEKIRKVFLLQCVLENVNCIRTSHIPVFFFVISHSIVIFFYFFVTVFSIKQLCAEVQTLELEDR